MKTMALPTLALVVTCAAGCTVRATPGVTTVSSAPVEIESSPYVTYEGRPTYYYQERWYYRDGGNWRYYHDEPAELHRQRPYVQQAPAARYHQEHYVAPATAPGPAPMSAPPAVRER